jgi:hypothetical protein
VRPHVNSLALNDVPDWVGQLVLEELLEVPESERNDYVKAAHTSVAENLKWYPELVNELGEARKNATSSRALEEYVGIYWEKLHVFKIVVTLEDGKLYWRFQGTSSLDVVAGCSDQGPAFWKAVF